MAGSVNSNYFSQVNSRFQTEVTRGDGASTQNLKNQSGVTHTAKKSNVKKGGNIAEEGSNLSEAAQKQLKSEATQHAEHTAEHGHEMAHDAGVDIAGNDSPEQSELRSKRGYEREQEALADGPTPDGKVKLTSPEGKTQILTVEDHDHLTAMDDPDVTDKHVLDDIPDVNLNAANATLDTQMAQGVSKVAILKTDPKIDAVAESMEVAPAPHLAEPMDIVGPGNDKLSTPMPMEFPPEMERVAAEKAALELASGESHQEAILAGPGMVQATAKPTPPVLEAQAIQNNLTFIETNSAAVNLLAGAPAGTWGQVADLLGVKPGQGKGVTPTGSPKEQQAQVLEWRVGHALELEQSGHRGLALQTLSGNHDRLVGKDVLATTVNNDATTQAFQQHYSAEGGRLKNEAFRPLPQDLHGRQVAFLAPDENGLLKEVRGQVKASSDQGSAIFELAGKPGQTFNNNYVHDLAVLPDNARSIAPMPAVTVPPEAFAAKLQNDRPMPRDEMLTKVAASATPRAAKVLFEAAGVKPGQCSDADFQPGQLNQWRLGQAAQLAEANQGPGMAEVLGGKWDNLAGQDVQQHLQQRAEFKTGFQDHYRKNGAKSVEENPHQLNGKTVAFLQENEKTGKLEEVRGVVQHEGDPLSAMFTLRGHPDVEFNSNYIDSVVVLPNQGVPPYAQPEAKAAMPKVPTTQLPPKAAIEQRYQISKPLAQATHAAPAPAENPYSKLNNIDLHGSYKDQIDKMQGHVNNIPEDQLEPLGDAAQARFLKADPPISTSCAWAGEVEQLANQRLQTGDGDPAHWQGVKKDAAAFQQMEAEVGKRLQQGGTDLKQLASEKQNFKTTFQEAMVSQPGSNQINRAPQADPAQPTKPAAQAEPTVPTTQLPPKATIDQLDQFSKPLAQTQLTAARSQLNPNQKKDLEQLETDVVRIRSLYKEMGARPQDQPFAAKAQQEIQQTQTRIGEVAGRNHAKNSNFQVIIDPTNGEVFTNLSWTNDKLSPEMQAQGHAGVAYSLQSSPGRTDSELTAWPLAKDGSVGGTYMKYRVASDNPKGWQGVAAVVGDVNGENGYHASAITPGSNTLTTHLNSDQQKMTPAQQALANQSMADAGLTWPGGATPPTPPEQQAYRNQPGQIQQPVQQGFIDRMRYAFTGNQNYAPNYSSAPPPYWQAPQPNYNYMGSYPQYQYPPVNYGGYGGYAGSWGGGYGGGYGGGFGGGGMNTMMKLMMASTMISSIAMPMMFFANSMMW